MYFALIPALKMILQVYKVNIFYMNFFLTSRWSEGLCEILQFVK